MAVNAVIVLFPMLFTVEFCIVLNNVKILQGNFSWEDAFNQPGCDFLGNEFMNVKLDNVRIQDLSETAGSLTKKNEYWIGAYVQYSKWIRLRGCFYVDVKRFDSIVGNANIQECTRYCNGLNFGLTSERCICFNTLEDTEEDFCRAAKCPNTVDEFCGNIIRGRRSCACVYQIVDLSSDNDIGNCKTVLVARSNEQLVTKDCSETHSFLCRGRRDNDDVDLYRQEKNWMDAGFACSLDYEKQFFSKPSRWGDVPNGQHWVGIFRKEIFQWGNITNRSEVFHCVSVTVNTDGRLQKFLKQCNSRLPLLCEQSSNKITGIISPYKTITTTKTDVLTTSTHMYSNNTTPDRNVQWLVIGLVGGVFITLVIVSMTVVILRCRKKSIEAGAIVNQTGDANSDANYDQINRERESQPYTELRNNSVTYDYISTADTSRDYLEIIEG